MYDIWILYVYLVLTILSGRKVGKSKSYMKIFYHLYLEHFKHWTGLFEIKMFRQNICIQVSGSIRIQFWFREWRNTLQYVPWNKTRKNRHFTFVIPVCKIVIRLMRLFLDLYPDPTQIPILRTSTIKVIDYFPESERLYLPMVLI